GAPCVGAGAEAGADDPADPAAAGADDPADAAAADDPAAGAADDAAAGAGDAAADRGGCAASGWLDETPPPDEPPDEPPGVPRVVTWAQVRSEPIIAARVAAPRATAYFGWVSTTTGRPISSETISATSGIRDDPPTSRTALSSSGS